MLNFITRNITLIIIQGFVGLLVLLIVARLVFAVREVFTSIRHIGFAQSIGIMEVQSDFHCICQAKNQPLL